MGRRDGLGTGRFEGACVRGRLGGDVGKGVVGAGVGMSVGRRDGKGDGRAVGAGAQATCPSVSSI